MKTAVFLLTVAFIGLQNPQGTEGQPGATQKSCKDIKLANAAAPSKIYSIKTVSSRQTIKVYCEMGLNKGGYTFLPPDALSVMNQADLDALFTDRKNVLIRYRHESGTQPFAVLEQLDQNKNTDLYLGLSQYAGYSTPVNADIIGSPFLFLGFLPIKPVSNKYTPGLKVNGIPNTFENCKAAPNSQITLYPNFVEKDPSTKDKSSDICTKAFSFLSLNPSQRVMPPEMYMFGETQWGGIGQCGCYKQTNNIRYNLGISIGIR